MASKTTQEMAARTRHLRLEVHRLMAEESLSENEALRKALPGDRNRTKKLQRWKDNGLWPVSESEIGGIAEQLKSGSKPKVHSDRQCNEPLNELPENELLRRVRSMLYNIEPAERPIGATAKGRKSPLQTTMIAIRIPTNLDEELKALGGLKSRHIEKAIMLYIRAMRAEGDIDV
jgi:hypothetical protein